jgi:hypothetical protein
MRGAQQQGQESNNILPRIKNFLNDDVVVNRCWSSQKTGRFIYKDAVWTEIQ